MALVYSTWLLIIVGSYMIVDAEDYSGCQYVATAVENNSVWTFNKRDKVLQWNWQDTQTENVPQCEVHFCCKLHITHELQLKVTYQRYTSSNLSFIILCSTTS